MVKNSIPEGVVIGDIPPAFAHHGAEEEEEEEEEGEIRDRNNNNMAG